MELPGITRSGLVAYLVAQVNHFFPDARGDIRPAVARSIDDALARMEGCTAAVRMWRPRSFDYLHSEQNAVFLAYLANAVWRNTADPVAATKLFYLNKALNGFTCFYDTPLPDIWFVGHSVGIVLVRTDYPDYFAIYQNCTVGRSEEDSPVLEPGILMYPNSAIIGRCHVRAGTVLSQGTSVINAETPGNAIAFAAEGGLVFKSAKRNLLGEVFRI